MGFEDFFFVVLLSIGVWAGWEAGRRHQADKDLELVERITPAPPPTSRDGLLSSEWIARTGRAERLRDEAIRERDDQIGQVQELLDAALAREGALREALDSCEAEFFGPELWGDVQALLDACERYFVERKDADVVGAMRRLNERVERTRSVLRNAVDKALQRGGEGSA